MDILQVIILAIVQGLTEFLPISSTAHLILIPQIMGWEDQGLSFDIALHIGSLIAVLFYFRQQLSILLKSWLDSIKIRQLTPESRLVWGLGLGTVPAAIIGLLSSHFKLEESLRTPLVIGVSLILFGLLLWNADRNGKQERDEYSLSWRDILLIGFAQAIAIIPGVSRSGITMTAALLLGLNRKGAARFSFLLSIPVIGLAGGYEMLPLLIHPTTVEWTDLVLGIVFSGISAYLCIHTFMGLLDRIGMLPFVIYRLIVGSCLILWVSG